MHTPDTFQLPLKTLRSIAMRGALKCAWGVTLLKCLFQLLRIDHLFHLLIQHLWVDCPCNESKRDPFYRYFNTCVQIHTLLACTSDLMSPLKLEETNWIFSFFLNAAGLGLWHEEKGLNSTSPSAILPMKITTLELILGLSEKLLLAPITGSLQGPSQGIAGGREFCQYSNVERPHCL